MDFVVGQKLNHHFKLHLNSIVRSTDSNYWSGIGWRDGALGATPGQLRNGPIVPAAGPTSRVLCIGQGVSASSRLVLVRPSPTIHIQIQTVLCIKCFNGTITVTSLSPNHHIWTVLVEYYSDNIGSYSIPPATMWKWRFLLRATYKQRANEYLLCTHRRIVM